MSEFNPFAEVGFAIGKSLMDDLRIIDHQGHSVEFKPHEAQSRFLDTKKRFIYVAAGVQGGKTIGGIIWLMKEVEKYPNEDFMVIVPTVKRLNQSTLKKFMEIVKPLKLGLYHKTDACFKLFSGGNIFFRTVEEDPDLIEGATLKAALVDEAGDISRQVYINLLARLAVKQGRALFISSLYTANWFYEQINPDMFNLPHDPDSEVVTFESRENPSFSDAEWEATARRMSKADFNRRYRAVMDRFEGLVYDLPKEVFVEDPFDGAAPTFKEVIAGVDWGYQHPAAIVVVGIHENNRLYVIDEWVHSKKKVNDIMEMAVSLKNKYQITNFYCDISRPENIAQLCDYPYYLPASAGRRVKVPEGCSYVRELFLTDRLKIVEKNVPNVMQELTLYHYKKTDNPYTPEEPEDVYNDALDALRYACITHPIPKLINEEEEIKAPSLHQIDIANLNDYAEGNSDYEEMWTTWGYD